MLWLITMVALLVFAFRERSLRLQQAAESAVYQAQLRAEINQHVARSTAEQQVRQRLELQLQSRESQRSRETNSPHATTEEPAP